jgi:DHA1 family bicyclomycin/chloramphenicol resistance-like MFS transporter
MARSLAYLTMVVAVANALAPSIGGLLTELMHWRAVFAALLVASALVLYATARYLPETLAPATGGGRGPGAIATLAQLATMPAFVTCALQSSVVYATFLVFASYMPYVMKSAFGGTPSGYGLWYLLIAGGYFLGNYAVTRYATRYGLRRLFRTGAVIQCAAAAFALLLAVLHVWLPIAVFGPWMVLAFGQGLILPNVTAAAVSLAPWAAGAAAGLLGFVQQLVASATVQALAGVPTDTPVPVSLFIATATAVGLASALTSTAGIPAHVAAQG